MFNGVSERVLGGGDLDKRRVFCSFRLAEFYGKKKIIA